jgi:hypothetical protein
LTSVVDQQQQQNMTSKFVQVNYGGANGIQIIPKGREADFTQINVPQDGRDDCGKERAEVQVVQQGEVKFQSAQGKSGATFTQHVYGGIGIQVAHMTTIDNRK